MLLFSVVRSSLMAILYIPFLLLCSISSVVMNLIFNSRKIDDSIIQFWGRWSCKMFGVNVHVAGLENIPQGGCLFLFNHTSFFDVFAMAGYLPGIRFGAKIELFSIPFFGLAMRRLGMLPIARQKREEVFKLYQASEVRIANGERFALAPEGTRQDSEVLGSFKAGPFVFAINAKAPIVPVVIKNASQILPKGSYIPNWNVWNRDIQIHILPYVNTTEFGMNQRPALQDLVRSKMLTLS